jgi:hypothetical protein
VPEVPSHNVGTEVSSWAVDFLDIFGEESFDSLPERQMWEHTIELVTETLEMRRLVNE